MNNKYYVENFDSDDENLLQVFYLIMANDYSNAGKYYNKFTIKFLNDRSFEYFYKHKKLSYY